MGPCGGVRADGGCEARPGPCVFDRPVLWTEPVAPVPLRAVPLILTDFTADPYSVPMLASVAAVLAPACDAVLVGEHHNRPDFPPVLHATLLQEAGLRPWVTLACRDRNGIVLEQELMGLRHIGVDAVLCVTGDARAPGLRPGVTQVFDLDGTRLAALAAGLGLSAVVPETPAAPPRALRGLRLAQKQRAGAAAAVLNHAPAGLVAQFMADAAAAGVSIPVIAATAVYTDARLGPGARPAAGPGPGAGRRPPGAEPARPGRGGHRGGGRRGAGAAGHPRCRRRQPVRPGLGPGV